MQCEIFLIKLKFIVAAGYLIFTNVVRNLALQIFEDV